MALQPGCPASTHDPWQEELPILLESSGGGGGARRSLAGLSDWALATGLSPGFTDVSPGATGHRRLFASGPSMRVCLPHPLAP